MMIASVQHSIDTKNHLPENCQPCSMMCKLHTRLLSKSVTVTCHMAHVTIRPGCNCCWAATVPHCSSLQTKVALDTCFDQHTIPRLGDNYMALHQYLTGRAAARIAGRRCMTPQLQAHSQAIEPGRLSRSSHSAAPSLSCSAAM
jgi:hypothetical protein